MVDKWRLFNLNFCSWKLATNLTLCNNQSNSIIITNSKNNKSNRNNDDVNQIPKYTKIYIENPFNNRNLVLKVTKNQKGVYIWESKNHKYVGHSINL